jgi:hypothetical protein
MQNLVLRELHGRLWHAIRPDRFKRILELGAILPIPENPDPDGWRTMDGEPYRSFAHTLGAISLFDVDEFDPESYATRCPMGSSQTLFRIEKSEDQQCGSRSIGRWSLPNSSRALIS